MVIYRVRTAGLTFLFFVRFLMLISDRFIKIHLFFNFTNTEVAYLWSKLLEYENIEYENDANFRRDGSFKIILGHLENSVFIDIRWGSVKTLIV